MVDTVQRVAVAVVVILQVEPIETQSCDDLHVAGQLDLVLSVSARDVRAEMVVGVGGVLPERDGCAGRRVGERHQNGRRAVVEKAGVPDVVGQLPSDLDAGEQRVTQPPARHAVGPVRLVEQIGSVRGVVVGGQRDLRLGRVHGSGHEVLIGAVVVADEGVIPDGGAPYLMIDRRGPQVDVRPHMARAWVAVERVEVHVRRPALKRRDAAIRDPRVV